MDYLTNKYDLDSYQEKRHFGGNDSTLNSLGLGTGVKRTRYGEPDPWSSILLGSRPMDSNNTYTLHVEGYNELLIMRAQYLHAYRPGTSTDRNAQCADGSCHISMFPTDSTNIANGSRFF